MKFCKTLSCIRFKMLISIIHNLDSYIFHFDYKHSYDHFLQANNECVRNKYCMRISA